MSVNTAPITTLGSLLIEITSLTVLDVLETPRQSVLPFGNCTTGKQEQHLLGYENLREKAAPHGLGSSVPEFHSSYIGGRTYPK